MESSIRAFTPKGLRIVETMRWDGIAFVRLDRHLARIGRTCAEVGFGFDIGVLRHALDAVTGGPKRVRLTVGVDSLPMVETANLAPSPEFWRVQIAKHRLNADDPWLRIKTTARALYDQARAALPDGVEEVIFLNGRGQVCEGTITNVFADLGEGLITPPLACGLLPGVLREEMLEKGDCHEGVLSAGDLSVAKRLYIGNSLRGLIAAQLV